MGKGPVKEEEAASQTLVAKGPANLIAANSPILKKKKQDRELIPRFLNLKSKLIFEIIRVHRGGIGKMRKANGL